MIPRCLLLLLPLSSILVVFKCPLCYCCFRGDNWEDPKNGPAAEPEAEQPAYNGPPGMAVDGLIETNWDHVSIMLII